MNTAAALRCEGLQLHFGARRVIDGISASFLPGQWTAIVGANGAGKSTWLSLLAGLRQADAGAVWLRQRPLAQWPLRERATRLVWLAQHGSTHDTTELAAMDVVRLARLPHHGLLGAADAADEAAVGAAMRETECSDLGARRLAQLSGGERQRVLLARALATADAHDAVWLLDEPTTHLDAPHQRALLRGLRARAQRGATVITVLHDLTLALAADRVLLLERGRVTADGVPGDAARHAELTQAFGGAWAIHRLEDEQAGGATRWVSMPRW